MKLIALYLLIFSIVKQSSSIDCQIASLADVNRNCTVVYGDIIINRTTTETFAHLCEKLENVEIIYGRLFFVETSYTNFSFLSSLQAIYYKPIYNQMTSYLQRALNIENNPQLKELGMPNLMTLTMEALLTDSRFFVTSIHDNPLLCVPVHQIENWLRNGRVSVPQMLYCGINITEETSTYKVYSVENSTKVYCSMLTFDATMPLGCQILDIGIWVANNFNETATDHFSKAIESVEFIMGIIVIRKTSVRVLNFSNLKTIYNVLYDNTERTGWGYQVMQFQDNANLTTINFPKLERIVHYGFDAFIKMSNNPQLQCSAENCEIFLRLHEFQLDSCSCGLIPNFNPGYTVWSLSFTILEAVCCATLTIGIYANVMIHVYKSGFTVSYFQFSMLVYFSLSCFEAVYNVLNNIKYHDGLDYPWFIGLQFLFISANDKFFYQAVNVVYTNRISLLLSCCLYRTISFVSFDHGKTAMGISFIIFIISNIWSFNVLMSTGSAYAYGLYLINWATLLVSIATAIFLFFYLRKNFDTYSELQKHQTKLSIAFILQAFLSFVFCGFPDGVFDFYEDRYTLNKFIRQKTVFEYYYGSIVIRWHYMVYGILIRFFLHEMLAKVDIRSDAVITTRKFKSTITPAKQAPALH